MSNFCQLKPLISLSISLVFSFQVPVKFSTYIVFSFFFFFLQDLWSSSPRISVLSLISYLEKIEPREITESCILFWLRSRYVFGLDSTRLYLWLMYFVERSFWKTLTKTFCSAGRTFLVRKTNDQTITKTN